MGKIYQMNYFGRICLCLGMIYQILYGKDTSNKVFGKDTSMYGKDTSMYGKDAPDTVWGGYIWRTVWEGYVCVWEGYVGYMR